MSVSADARSVEDAFADAVEATDGLSLRGAATGDDVVYAEFGTRRTPSLRSASRSILRILHGVVDDLPEGAALDMLFHSARDTFRLELSAEFLDEWRDGVDEDLIDQRVVRQIRLHDI